VAIITISRGTFSGGQRLAECVAEKLGCRCISREVLVETARLYGIPEEKLSGAISDTPAVMEHLHSERKRYLACIRAALIRAAKDYNLVYHGHAGHFLLKGVPRVLRVRVIANMAFRIRALTENNNLIREEAIQVIKRLDENRLKWTKFLYHMDWRDPSLYDVVINLDHVSLSGACEIVYNTARIEQYQPTPEARKLMDDLVLSSHLEAMIANTRGISGGEDIEIEADGGLVTIRGTVGSLVDADRVRMLVRKTPGVNQVNSRMQVRLSGFSLAAID
jgi:cytidylate kinase